MDKVRVLPARRAFVHEVRSSAVSGELASENFPHRSRPPSQGLTGSSDLGRNINEDP